MRGRRDSLEGSTSQFLMGSWPRRQVLVEWITDLETALSEGKRREDTAFILVTVEWCPWCRKMDDETLSDEGVRKAIAPLLLARLDGDAYENLPYDYDFDVYPTVLLFGGDGEYRGMVEGFLEPEEFLSQLGEVLAG